MRRPTTKKAEKNLKDLCRWIQGGFIGHDWQIPHPGLGELESAPGMCANAHPPPVLDQISVCAGRGSYRTATKGIEKRLRITPETRYAPPDTRSLAWIAGEV